MLDGRQYRSDQPATCTLAQRDVTGYCPGDLLPTRTMLGAEQRDWLLENLASTKARWNIMAQQTSFSPINRALINEPRRFTAGSDYWDGCVAERQQIIDWFVEHETPNVVVLTGDTHQNWVRDVPRHYSSFDNPVATEFMCTSISTGGKAATPILRFEDPVNPHIHLQNNDRGYVKCTLTPDDWTSEFRIAETVMETTSPMKSLATFVVENGKPGAQRVAP